MIDGVQLKLCGVTTLVDAEFADRCGVDRLGFILYPKSPRYLSLRQFAAMAQLLPERDRVAVSVEPTRDELRAMRDAGFDAFQIHFRVDLPPERVAEWSATATPEKLWLAPKLAPGANFPDAYLPFARTFLLDGFQADKFGGTGHTGDWGAYRSLREAHPDKTWILSGGLSPANIGAALAATDARHVDVNSGVESAPGVKDHEKLKAFAVALHQARLRAPAAGA